MSVHPIHSWYLRKLEEALDPLELELQEVVSCHVGVMGKYSLRGLKGQFLCLCTAQRSVLVNV